MPPLHAPPPALLTHLRRAATPAVLVLALTAAFAGLVTTTSFASPAAAPAEPAQTTALVSVRTAESRASRDRDRPVLPSAARPSDGALTSTFGQRWGRLHAGLDFATGTGAPVRAAAEGTVASVGAESGYGTTVRVHHADGAETVYAHLSAAEVEPGQPVAVGQHLGREGSTGQSTGAHLHFEVRYDGAPVDPAVWLVARGVSP